MSYHFKRLTDPETIQNVMTDPEMWERISEDGQDPTKFVAIIDEILHWIGLYHGDTLFGVSCIHPHSANVGVSHINILEPYRKDHGLRGGLMSLQYAVKHTEYAKYISEVAIIYPEVSGFIGKLGFVREGINRQSMLKGGEMIDQIMFGATINEIEDAIEQLEKKVNHK